MDPIQPSGNNLDNTEIGSDYSLYAKGEDFNLEQIVNRVSKNPETAAFDIHGTIGLHNDESLGDIFDELRGALRDSKFKQSIQNSYISLANVLREGFPLKQIHGVIFDAYCTILDCEGSRFMKEDGNSSSFLREYEEKAKEIIGNLNQILLTIFPDDQTEIREQTLLKFGDRLYSKELDIPERELSQIMKVVNRYISVKKRYTY